LGFCKRFVAPANILSFASFCFDDAPIFILSFATLLMLRAVLELARNASAAAPLAATATCAESSRRSEHTAALAPAACHRKNDLVSRGE
jgi:hypothetical protein